MPNYEECVIYSIRSGDNLYVGSTCNFTKRKWNHNHYLKNENSKHHNFKIYKTIRENDGEWDMQPYKLFPCKSKSEMRIEEERCRVELNADLNTKACYLEDKYYYQKQYSKNNAKQLKANRQTTCECGCNVFYGNLPRHRKSNKHLKLMENIKE
tara:strand:- start:46 stop:507 length:462 start_codon:yes stop_codon:yes gene_type:complete